MRVSAAIMGFSPPPGLRSTRAASCSLLITPATREGAAKDVAHDLENSEVRANFRQLVFALLWIFYPRGAIDFGIFQILVRIESGFT